MIQLTLCKKNKTEVGSNICQAKDVCVCVCVLHEQILCFKMSVHFETVRGNRLTGYTNQVHMGASKTHNTHTTAGTPEKREGRLKPIPTCLCAEGLVKGWQPKC